VSQQVLSLLFSPDGRRLACRTSASYGGPSGEVWDAQTGARLTSLASTPACLAFSPDGRRIAAGSSDGKVAVFDTTTGNGLFSLKGHTGSVPEVAFSPDGKRLASASTDGTVRLWDVATGEEVYVLHAHSGALSGVAFSSDGRRIAAVGVEVVVWDASP
jgi:WD40 repeat protein